ncbi:MAG: M48 family metallopeptidase [Gammaproteobacteria bacterium]|nr:M48 family metallopeptidase [Gammaproteobacteria bacterium]
MIADDKAGDLYYVKTTGKLVKDFDSANVVKNICHRFSLNESTAAKLLKPEVVVKKGVNREMAQKFKASLHALGLIVVVLNEADSFVNESGSVINVAKTKEDFKLMLAAPVTKAGVNLKYKTGMLIVIAISLLAPMIYAGIVASLVIGVYSYIQHIPELVSGISNATVKLSVIILPVFIALVLFLFIVKPIFVRHRRPEEYVLQYQQFPALFNLVEVMCEKTGVPVPQKIVLNNEVNASASSLSGISGLVRGKLKLTVGLPLIMGMNIRQFAGVVAHELGHFAQPVAMMAYYFVNTINCWFASRAYEEDSWDQRLEEWGETASWHIVGSLAIMGGQLGISLTRKLFSGLYMINLRATRFMSQHMEYDADAYESIFSGSDEFENTAMQLRKLAYAEQDVKEININAWNDNRLLENIPLAISTIAENYDKDIEYYIRKDMEKEQTNAWDSHPADKDRILHVIERNDTAIIDDEYPAYLLTDDIAKLCQQLTLHDYYEYGIQKAEQYIEDNSLILEIDRSKQSAQKAMTEFFNGNYYGRILSFKIIDSGLEQVEDVTKIIDQLRNRMPDYTRLNEEYQELMDRYSVMTMGHVYLKNGIKLDLPDFYLISAEISQVQQDIKLTHESILKSSEKLKLIDQLFYFRLQLDIKLMSVEQRQLIGKELAVLNRIERLSDLLFGLQHNCRVVEALIGNEKSILTKVGNDIKSYSQFCLDDADSLLKLCADIPCVKDNYDNLIDFVEGWCSHFPDKYADPDALEVLSFSSQVSKAIKYYYYWVLAGICEQAVMIEKKNNISPVKLV